MTTLSLSNLRQAVSRIDATGLGIPALVLLIMSMLVLPLPAWLLDILFTFNILISLIVIMVAVGIRLAGVVGVAGGPLSVATRSPAFFCRYISATWPFFLAI